jgi:hypothetical protein
MALFFAGRLARLLPAPHPMALFSAIKRQPAYFTVFAAASVVS